MIMGMDDLPSVKDALISLSIERSLSEISEAVCENVGNKLYKKYKCYFDAFIFYYNLFIRQRILQGLCLASHVFELFELIKHRV